MPAKIETEKKEYLFCITEDTSLFKVFERQKGDTTWNIRGYIAYEGKSKYPRASTLLDILNGNRDLEGKVYPFVKHNKQNKLIRII